MEAGTANTRASVVCEGVAALPHPANEMIIKHAKKIKTIRECKFLPPDTEEPAMHRRTVAHVTNPSLFPR